MKKLILYAFVFALLTSLQAQMPVVYKATFTASSAAKEIKTYYLKSAYADLQTSELVFQNVVWITSVYNKDTARYHYATEYRVSKCDTLLMYGGVYAPLATYFDRSYNAGLDDLMKVNKYIILKFPHLKPYTK